MSTTSLQQTIVNCLGAPWPEDLSPSFLDRLREQGVGIVGCTANLTWDDTLESIENVEAVKAIVREHPHAYILRSAAELDREENREKVGVLLGLQNPKPLADSLRLVGRFLRSGTALSRTRFQREQLLWLRLCLRSRYRPHFARQEGDQAHERNRHRHRPVALRRPHGDGSPRIFRAAGDLQPSTSRAFQPPRSAPDPLIVRGKEGGVICQDVRANTSVAEYADWIDYCVKLAGIDHVGVSAQDDWHRSYKDTKRIAPYLPSFAAEFANRDWSEDRIYRRDGIGAKLLDRQNLAAELSGRNYSDESIDKILGGNMMRVLRSVLR